MQLYNLNNYESTINATTSEKIVMQQSYSNTRLYVLGVHLRLPRCLIFGEVTEMRSCHLRLSWVKT